MQPRQPVPQSPKPPTCSAGGCNTLSNIPRRKDTAPSIILGTHTRRKPTSTMSTTTTSTGSLTVGTSITPVSSSENVSGSNGTPPNNSSMTTHTTSSVSTWSAPSTSSVSTLTPPSPSIAISTFNSNTTTSKESSSSTQTSSLYPLAMTPTSRSLTPMSQSLTPPSQTNASASTTSPTIKAHNRTGIIVGAVLGSLAAFSLLVYAVLLFLKRRQSYRSVYGQRRSRDMEQTSTMAVRWSRETTDADVSVWNTGMQQDNHSIHNQSLKETPFQQRMSTLYSQRDIPDTPPSHGGSAATFKFDQPAEEPFVAYGYTAPEHRLSTPPAKISANKEVNLTEVDVVVSEILRSMTSQKRRMRRQSVSGKLPKRMDASLMGFDTVSSSPITSNISGSVTRSAESLI